MDKKLASYLQTHKIQFKEYSHEAVFTVEESSKIKQEIPGLHCKCLFLKDPKDNFYLIGMPAQKRLDMKALRKALQAKKLNFASPEELKTHLGLTPGSVSIFGMINSSSTTLILDKEVWQAKEVGFHPNINTSTLVLDHKNLEKFYNSLSSNKLILEL